MNFLHPILFASGAACVLVPIIIHLLMRRRRRPVEWAAMRFLQEALRRTRRRRLIEKWLLLAARCLLVALIAVALGRPLVGAGAATAAAGRTFYLVLDNSIASALTGPDGRSSLARHQDAARRILDTMGEADRVGLVLLAAPADATVVPASTNRTAVRSLIDGATPADSGADFAGAMSRLGAALSNPDAPGERLVVLLSDFRTGSADVQSGLARLPSGVRLVASEPGAAPADNVSIARLSALRQVVLPREDGQAQTATAQLERSGAGVDRPRITTVRLSLVTADGRSLATGQGVARFGPGERTAAATVALDLSGSASSLASGSGAMLVGQIDADALVRDDQWRLPIETRETLRLGVVSEGSWRPSAGAESLRPAQWVGLALRPSESGSIELMDLDPAALDAARLAGLDGVVITSPHRVGEEGWRRMGAFARSGGLVIVFPAVESTVQGWTDAMTTGLGVEWTFAREALTWPDTGRPRIAGGLPAGTPVEDDLLSAVRGELTELTRPVSVLRLLSVRAESDSGRPLLALEDGTPLVFSGRLRAARPAAAPGNSPADGEAATRGMVVFVAVALEPEWTDLPAKPLVVPLVQELVRQGVGKARPALWARAGTPLRVPAQTSELRPAAGTDSPTLAVSDAGTTREPVRRAGGFVAADARGGPRGLIATNPDAAAARVDAQDRAAIGAWLGACIEGGPAGVVWLDESAASASGGALALALQASQSGAPSGPALLALAALIALVETAIARWSSHARGETAQTGASRA